MKLLRISALLAFVALLTTAASAQLVTPQGRLSLSSTQAVMSSDVTGSTAIYYVAYVGTLVPVNHSGTWTNQQSASLPLTLTLNSSVQASGDIYDIFMFVNSTTAKEELGIGPAWASTTSRGSGTGSTAISRDTIQGFWVNTNAITLYNGTSSFSVPAGQATYLGSAAMTANGETSVQLKPNAVGGGTNNVIGLFNAYNRVRVNSLGRDSTSTWNYSTANSWEPADNSTNNRITWLDGLQQTPVKARYQTLWQAAGNDQAAVLGINLDSSTNTPDMESGGTTPTATGFNDSIEIEESFPPQFGLHYVQAMESVSGPSVSIGFFGTPFQSLVLDTEY